ncbi:hypothetical protein PSHT_12819 [Puccinia striiformis]|uniref:Retrotransposon gag domain-containing protein n=1 Tax=Puccinia striiformis TaxID=27350 RepID=A0A2S4UU60_9BASI|nr:hypothetical protein PSHT_12819 [Puccinia striiformis]
MQNTEVPAALGNNPVSNHPKSPANEQANSDSPSTGSLTGSSTRDLLRALLASQQASVNQSMLAQTNWEERMARTEAASAVRIARLEEASEGPAYTGPYQEIEPFVVWMNAIELFFTSKDISSDRDRIIIAGGRILETNLMGFFKTSASKLLLGTWEEFKAEMFTFAIPARWRTTLQRQIRFIKIGSNESFMQYTLRAHTLQQLLNFDQVTVSDHELAEGMTFGLGEDLENCINELEILETKPFDFNVFVKRVGDCVRAASKKTSHSPRSIGSTSHLAQSPQTTTHLKALWQYLGRMSGSSQLRSSPHSDHVQGPPKPSNYVAPQAWKGPNNRPAPSNAGRATSRPAGVAAVTDDGNGDQVDPINDADPEADELDYLASISALAIVDGELMASEIDEATVSLYTGIDPASVAALWGFLKTTQMRRSSSTRSIPRAGYQIYKETSLHSKSPATTNTSPYSSSLVNSDTPHLPFPRLFSGALGCRKLVVAAQGFIQNQVTSELSFTADYYPAPERHSVSTSTISTKFPFLSPFSIEFSCRCLAKSFHI